MMLSREEAFLIFFVEEGVEADLRSLRDADLLTLIAEHSI
jgi:hypothetical protein